MTYVVTTWEIDTQGQRVCLLGIPTWRQCSLLILRCIPKNHCMYIMVPASVKKLNLTSENKESEKLIWRLTNKEEQRNPVRKVFGLSAMRIPGLGTSIEHSWTVVWNPDLCVCIYINFSGEQWACNNESCLFLIDWLIVIYCAEPRHACFNKSWVQRENNLAFCCVNL